MSLYNQLHGTNPNAAILCSWLDIDQPDSKYESGRFRDIYLAEDAKKIWLYTRNGGGNREEYQEINDHLATHPNYIRDWDDDFDQTYAYFEFRVPKIYRKVARLMWDGEEPKSISEKFKATMAEMESMSPDEVRKDPRFAPTFQILEDIEKGNTPEDGVFRV